MKFGDGPLPIALNYEFQIGENKWKSYDSKYLRQIVKTSKQFDVNENLLYCWVTFQNKNGVTR